MTDTKMPPIPKGLELTQEQIDAISGGLEVCTASFWSEITAELGRNYENLVDFTSYVMERVSNSLK